MVSLWAKPVKLPGGAHLNIEGAATPPRFAKIDIAGGTSDWTRYELLTTTKLGKARKGRELDVRTGFRTRPVTVIHKGDWKLHLFHEEWQLDGGREKLATNHAVELYHLKEDIGERNDLATTNIAKRNSSGPRNSSACSS